MKALLAIFSVGFTMALITGCDSSTANTYDGSGDSDSHSSGNNVSDPDSDPTTTPTGTGGGGNAQLDSEEQAFLTQINAYRAANGLKALTLSPTLTAAAEWLSQDMATKDYLSHTDSTGRDFASRIEDFGYAYSTIGENIAYGNETATGTFNQWKNSAGHNANMLSSYYATIGIARFNYNGTSWGWYWTTDFGGKSE